MPSIDRIAFPADFTWGVATAAYQIEGAAHEDGRGESIWDRFSHTPGKTLNGDTGDVACDHYHRVDEDIQIIKAIGASAYRFSIAWPRIIPDGGQAVNQAGIDFYSQLVDKLLAADITPYATLYHWDLPQPLEDRGGWKNRETADRFAHYADVMTRALADRVKCWATLNEPWCSAFLGYGVGEHAPGRKDGTKAVLQAAHTLFLAHGKAVQVARQNNAGQVGIVYNPMQVEAASDSAEDLAAARRLDGSGTRWYLDPVLRGAYPEDMLELFGAEAPAVAPGDMAIICAPLDFIGVNFYNRVVVRHDPNGGPLQLGGVHPEGQYTEMDWEVNPRFYRLLMRIHQDYHPKSIYVTENGAAYPDWLAVDGVHDERRIAYLRGHLSAVGRAAADGAPMTGYFVWSLMDNFEWAWGYARRFGIVYVDYKDGLGRTLKDSAKYYRSVLTDNAITG